MCHFEEQERLRLEAGRLTGHAREDVLLSLQALEAEADRQALLHWLDEEFNRADMFLTLSETNPEAAAIYQFIYSNRVRLCSWVGFVACVALSFPEVEWTKEKLVAKDHPPSLVR